MDDDRREKRETMDGFERRKEQSRQAILRAAQELFGQFGVERVSIADIARKAGVSQATIYNHFRSKEQVAREFAAAAIEQLVNRAEEVLAAVRPYPDKMAAFIRFIADAAGQEAPPAGLTVHLDLLDDPDIRRIRDAARERMSALLLQLVREGKEQGQVDAQLSEEALSIHFQAYMDVFTGPQLQPRLRRDPGLLQDLGRLMIYGVRGRPETDRVS